VQNPPRDERSLQRRIAALEQRIRVLETTPRPGIVLVTKTLDETVNNNAALQDDNELFVALDINAMYLFRAFLIYDSVSTAAEMKMAFTVPANTTLVWSPNGLSIAATTRVDSVDQKEVTGSGTQSTTGTIAGSSPLLISPHGVVTTTDTDGDLHFQWAQGNATVEDTVVRANSYLYLQRIP
jgi:hypothetical protein